MTDTLIERAASPPEIALSEAETVLLDVSGAVYYTLRGTVAVRIWNLLARPQTAAELTQTLIDEFDVDRDTCEQQVGDFIRLLVEKGLLRTIERQS